MNGLVPVQVISQALHEYDSGRLANNAVMSAGGGPLFYGNRGTFSVAMGEPPAPSVVRISGCLSSWKNGTAGCAAGSRITVTGEALDTLGCVHQRVGAVSIASHAQPLAGQLHAANGFAYWAVAHAERAKQQQHQLQLCRGPTSQHSSAYQLRCRLQHVQFMPCKW